MEPRRFADCPYPLSREAVEPLDFEQAEAVAQQLAPCIRRHHAASTSFEQASAHFGLHLLDARTDRRNGPVRSFRAACDASRLNDVYENSEI